MNDEETPVEPSPDPEQPPVSPPEDESPFDVQPLDIVEKGFDPSRTETRDGD